MKKVFYSLTVSTILLVLLSILAYKFWSIPVIIVWILFLVLYFEKAREWRKSQKDN